jgi:hypothetical protein
MAGEVTDDLTSVRSAAESLREAVELLARDDRAGAEDMRPLMDTARSLGFRWAALCPEGNSNAEAAIVAVFGHWVDLERAFVGALEEAHRENADLEAADHFDADIMAEITDERLAALKASIPGFADWCAAHCRAVHRWGDALCSCCVGQDLQDVVSFIVREDAEIGREDPGGPFRVDLRRRAITAIGLSLRDAIRNAMTLAFDLS